VVGLLSGTSGFEIAPSRVLSLTKAEESFVFNNVKGKHKNKTKKRMRRFGHKAETEMLIFSLRTV
jgi:hypothetical protein